MIFSILFLIAIGFGACVLLYVSIVKKWKRGIAFSLPFVLLFVYGLMMNYIDQWTISKADVTADLSELHVELQDDFEVSQNDVSGMPERIQYTHLNVSQKDAKRIIESIKNAANFYVGNPSDQPNDKIYNSQNNDRFFRERRNVFLTMQLSIDTNNYSLHYSKIEM